MRQAVGGGVIGQVVEASNPRIALLDAPDRFADLVRFGQSSICNPCTELFHISEQTLLVFFPDRFVLGDALLAAAKDIGAALAGDELDVDTALVLLGIGRRGLTDHRRKADLIGKRGEPALTLRLAAGDDVMELALLE